MAASIARTSSTFLRNFCRTTNKSINISHSLPLPTSTRSNFVFQQTRISTLRSPARLRRESLFLNSMLPVHSAIASACLISKLPTEASTSTDAWQRNIKSFHTNRVAVIVWCGGVRVVVKMMVKHVSGGGDGGGGPSVDGGSDDDGGGVGATLLVAFGSRGGNCTIMWCSGGGGIVRVAVVQGLGWQ
ncbi:hypothetical protein BVC80_1711g42 [Macleaya cordata]|uniref:Uncharacterized protein n=1 Tax=Macleaya cordata TaxID=56857 RepID=A0A200Q2I9_MACCD|nr:hypothetical protein BVC80_1711g42 [Macleaya cordata]